MNLREFATNVARRFPKTVPLFLFVAVLSWCGVAAAAPDNFVKASGVNFTLAGKPFFITGVNNHYLTFGSRAEVDRVLDDAVAMGANVVRVILQPVIGSLDGSVPTIWDWNSRADSSDLGVHGNYLIYWDSATGKMAIHDGPHGMQRVDYLVAAAKQRHLKLLIAFLDFWSYTGGAQQMRAWYGSSNKNTFFFSDSRTKRDYKDWVHYVVNRRNVYTGLRYKDDPTIMGWDLMNEPNGEPAGLLRQWTAEMSAYVKSQDPNHLVSSGLANVNQRLSDLTIPSIDFGTWHGYPLYYELTVDQFNRLIGDFCGIAAADGKPVLLEEFGYARSNPDQVAAYAKWLNTMREDRDCAGWVVWRLVARQDNGKYPKDEHDQFDIHNDGSPIWKLLKTATAEAAATRDAAGPPPNPTTKRAGRRR
ncbi:MAG TPA: cellulase family glycosylhydrolase [Stellaceae bacterium]|nr:cellulase family glycosylhydrolase [Stellaceae bacterium]